MVFNATFNNISDISCRSALLVEETGLPGENHRPAARHWQTWSHNVVSCEFQFYSGGVLDTTLCDQVCQCLAAGRWFSPGNPVSSTNKADLHDISEILLKVALNTINLTT
jgi:hypothetical protein